MNYKNLIERLKDQRDRDAAEHCPAEIIALQDETIAAFEAQQAENKRLQQETINRSCNEAKLCAECDALAAKLVPLGRDEVKVILSEAGYVHVSAQSKADFINGLRHGEKAHGIQAKGGQPAQAQEPSFPLISLGYGRIEVAEGHHEGTHALIFGRSGTGQIGEPTQPEREHQPGETLAVVTFANVESLDVVAEKLRVLRQKITGVEQVQEPVAVASIFVTFSGEREIDDWRHPLPVGRNLLYTHPAPKQAEPTGYKLVPVEPTQAMIDAFHFEDGESASNKWGAMLTAAPIAPEAQ